MQYISRDSPGISIIPDWQVSSFDIHAQKEWGRVWGPETILELKVNGLIASKTCGLDQQVSDEAETQTIKCARCLPTLHKFLPTSRACTVALSLAALVLANWRFTSNRHNSAAEIV